VLDCAQSDLKFRKAGIIWSPARVYTIGGAPTHFHLRRLANLLSVMAAAALYINLYSPTSGSKEKKTYIRINTVKKKQKKQKNSEQV